MNAQIKLPAFWVKKSIAILIACFVIIGCTNEQPTAPSRIDEPPASLLKNNLNLELFAKSLAKLLAKADQKNVLMKEIVRATGKERIIDFKSYLQKYGIVEKLADVSEFSISDLESKLNQLPEYLDLYFPVKQHRNLFPDSHELLVAVDPGIDEKDLNEITAFDLKGKKIKLSTEEPPSIPTLVLSISEHRENQYFEVMSDSVPYYPPAPPTTPNHHWGDKEIFYKISISNDQEPWLRGDPEIYASYAFANNVGLKWKYFMENVDDEDTWYTINGHLFYWQQSYGDVLMMSIWEQDGGANLIKNITFQGKTYGIEFFDGDDELGSNPVHFLDPSPSYYSTGYAEYKMKYQAP